MTDIVKRRDGAAARVKQEAAGPDYLTVLEVAVLARCEHKRVRRAIASGQLVAFRPAGKLLVREEDARAWIERHPVHAARPKEPSRARSRRRVAPRASAGDVAKLREMERRVA
jgi:excisionase family DNA binding protein